MRIEFLGSPIRSISMLARALGVHVDVLNNIVKDPVAYYSVSLLPKKSGDFRTISDPVKELKSIQRRIVRRLFASCKFPTYLHGSIRDNDFPRDFVRNAQAHREAHEVVAFDIDSFFPSVRPGIVKIVYKYLFNFSDDVAELLTGLTTFNDGLPQGAPTSPYLANLVFYDCEYKVAQTLSDKGFVYTRLVDDITVSSKVRFSGDEKKFVYGQILSMLRLKNLAISQKKYKITNTLLHGAKTQVTGLVVEDGKVKFPKERVKEVGGLVYALARHAAVDPSTPEYHKMFGRASGLVALYTRLDSSKAKGYRSSLQLIMPIYSAARVKKIAWLCRNFTRYSQDHPDRWDAEGYTRKYYRFRHKINIIRRTHRKLAIELAVSMDKHKPTRLLASFYE